MENPKPRKSADQVKGAVTTNRLRQGDFSSVLERNIKALKLRRKSEEERAGPQTRMAEAITRFSGSMPFVYLHAVIVLFWVAVNLRWISALPAFDNTFVILATVASVEGIFLSTFVLISQNRAAAAADRRAELDVQVNLLSEHEITRLLQLTVAVAEKLGVGEAGDPSLGELEGHIAPEKVLDKIEHEEGAPGEVATDPDQSSAANLR